MNPKVGQKWRLRPTREAPDALIGAVESIDEDHVSIRLEDRTLLSPAIDTLQKTWELIEDAQDNPANER
jgi:hypothetical protein